MTEGHDIMHRWLSIVGVGEDGREGLSASALALLEQAVLVIGGRRHLDLIGPTRDNRRIWATPLEATIPDIIARRGEPVCVLASGDPFWFGVGATLARHIPIAEMLAAPGPSSFSLAASRLGWTLQDTVTLGLNMPGYVPLIRRHLHHGSRILALCLNGETPRAVAHVLVECGFARSTMWVLEALGGPRERIRQTTPATFDIADAVPLNMIAIEVEASGNARQIALTPGLSDDMFEHDGQITKREIRAVTLSSLAPMPRQLLWDVGLGSGSVAIEWLLAHPSMRAIGFERDEGRAARAVRNAVAFGVPNLDVRIGGTPDMFVAVDAPDAIFIGGGATEPGIVDTCWSALKAGGRMVINAVTIGTEMTVLNAFERYGGTCTRISIDRAKPVGGKMGWRPAMPVLQWVGVKP